MANSTGWVQGENRWHVSNSPEKPGKLIVLGSILTKPHDLESSLNYRQLMKSPFPKDKTRDQTEAARRFVRSNESKSTGGRVQGLVPFSPVASAGGRLSAEVSRSVEYTVEASGVRAVAIMPDVAAAWVDEALQLPNVAKHVKQWAFEVPLFMIVGVATCKRLYLGRVSSRGRAGALDIDGSVSVAGVEAGVGASRDKTRRGEVEVEIDEERDFAYRVREFQYSRRKKQIKKSADVTQGAMFGNDDQDAQLEEVEWVPVFEGFESEDEDLS